MENPENEPAIEFWIWLSGFFDGEGSIGIYRGRPNGCYRLNVKLTQADPEILSEIHDSLGGSLSKWTPVLTPKRNVVDLVWGNNEACGYVLSKMLPYLRVKKEQAKLAIEFSRLPWRHRGHGGLRRKVSEDEKETEGLYAARMKRLKPRNWPRTFESQREILDFAFN